MKVTANDYEPPAQLYWKNSVGGLITSETSCVINLQDSIQYGKSWSTLTFIAIEELDGTMISVVAQGPDKKTWAEQDMEFELKIRNIEGV